MFGRLVLSVATLALVAYATSPAIAQTSEGRGGRAKAASKPAARERAQAGRRVVRATKDDDDDDKGKNGKSGKNGRNGKDDDDDDGVETENLFGFTEGTDVGEKGEIGASAETVGSFGKRAGTFRALESKVELEYAPFERFNVAVGATANRTVVRNVPGLDNSSGAGLGGFSLEFKYNLVKRGPSSPIGVTLVAEPSIGFIDAASGRRAASRGVEARIAFDAALVPEQVFAAVNVIYEGEASRPRGFAAFDAGGASVEFGDPGAAYLARLPEERESTFGLSGALAFRVAKDVFVGGEARYFRAYEGLGFQRFEGQALFVGPTIYAKLADKVSLQAAFSSQVAGKAADEPGRLDLENFERHQAKLKLSVEF